MYEYLISIKNNNKIICTVGANNLEYDNVLWWQLEKLIKIVKEGFNSKEDLLSRIENKCEYFHRTKTSKNCNVLIDLDKGIMNKPFFPVYKPEEVSKENCCIDLKIKDGKHYAVYEEEEFPMEYISFKKPELLNKKEVTLDECLEITEFVSSLLNPSEITDYVLNNESIIRFNIA